MDLGERPLDGRTATARLTVTFADTAIAAGSGDLPVLATPRLVALMEQAACSALEGILPDGRTSVGVHVDIRHLAPSPVGAEVTATATVVSVDGSRITFEVRGTHSIAGDEIAIGTGTHVRVSVDRDAFLARIR